MATTKSDYGSLPRRKLTTYSKAAKSRQPKSPLAAPGNPTPTSASASRSTSTSTPASTAAATGSAPAPDIYDLPDDDDDVPGSTAPSRYAPSRPKPKPKPKPKPTLKTQPRPNVQQRSNHEPSQAIASIPASVPAPAPVFASAVAANQLIAPTSATARKRKVPHADVDPPAAPETATRPRASRQKAVTASPSVTQPLPRENAAPSRSAFTPPHQAWPAEMEDDVDIVDAGPEEPLQQPGRRAPPSSKPAEQLAVWDDISASSGLSRPRPLHKSSEPRQQNIPVRPAPASPPTSVKPRPRAPVTATRKPKRRLIDALVEQTEPDDQGFSDDDEERDDAQVMRASQPFADIPMVDNDMTPEPTSRPADGPVTPLAQARTTRPRTFARASSALKFTYGQGRKVLEQEEDDLLESLSLPQDSAPSLKGRRLELGRPSQLLGSTGTGDEDDLEDTDSPKKKKIRDIHELRQAGANSRVADEMQDLLDQIGRPSDKPASARRGALLQVAENIHDRNFMRQCRDHGVEERIVQDLAREKDVISAFLALSSILTILAKWPSAHFVRMLQAAQVGVVIARLLPISDDVKKIVRDRKTNLSRRNQSAVVAVEAKLLKIPAVWDTGTPKSLTPRALAIKCLHVLIEPDHTLTRDPAIFPTSIAESLLGVLCEARGETEHVDYPHTDESLELFGALSLFKYQALGTASTPVEKSDWSDEYLSAVADVFGACSERVNLDNRALESCVLELTMNLANNNLKAPSIFIDKGLVPAIASSIGDSVGSVLGTVAKGETLVEEVLNILILRLGVLINFSEHSTVVRQVVCDCQHGERWPIDDLLRLFLENYRRTSEADSVEQTRLNVAFGYLAVLLGYLCLYQPARKKFRSAHSSRSLGPLLDSIREFVRLMGTLESHLSEGDEGDEGHRSHAGLAKLEALAHQLEDEAAYD